MASEDPEGNEGTLNLLAVGIAGAFGGDCDDHSIVPNRCRKEPATECRQIRPSPRKSFGRSTWMMDGGLKAFYTGIGLALARSIPATSATLLGLELATQAMNERLVLERLH